MRESSSPYWQRRCLLKECEQPFRPTYPQERYCSAACCLRLFTLGVAEWLAAPLSGRPLLHGKLAPEPWPEVRHDSKLLTEQAFCSQELSP
jgi:hypothetical protein